MNGHHKSLDELNELVKAKALKPEAARSIYSIKQNFDKAREKAELEFWKDKMYDIAQNLADKFGLGSEQNAYEEMNQYSRTERKAIKEFYDSFIQEQRTAKQNQDKAKALRQEQNYNSFHKYWDNGNPVPNDILRNMFDSEEITETHYTRAQTVNAALADRKGIEDNLIKNMDGFTALSRNEQEKIIMRHMGINEEKHKEAFSYLYRQVIDGKATDALIDWYFAHGRITTDDKERLKEYDSKFDKQQKAVIQSLANQLRNDIRAMGINKDSRPYELLAVNQFYDDTRLIDTHAKNFNDALMQYYEQAKNTVALEVAKRFNLTQSKFLGFGQTDTPLGERIKAVMNSQPEIPAVNRQITYTDLDGNEQVMNLLGDVSQWDNSALIPPPPEPEPEPALREPMPYGSFNNLSSPYLDRITSPDAYISGQQQRRNVQPQQNNNDNPLRGIIDITKHVLQGISHYVTDGYYAARKAYRQGRSHFAIDLRAPVGTPVVVPDSPDQWTVVRTGYNSKAGNNITISTTNYNGDRVEITFAHLSSVDVKKGDVLSQGSVIAKSGNSGNTTAPHLHISAKVNGKTVNPQHIDWGEPDSESQPYTQNNLIQPEVDLSALVSSDEKQQQRVRQFFFGNGLSPDIFIDNPLWR